LLIAVTVDFEGKYHAKEKDRLVNDQCGMFAIHVSILHLMLSAYRIIVRNRSRLLLNFDVIMNLRS